MANHDIGPMPRGPQIQPVEASPARVLDQARAEGRSVQQVLASRNLPDGERAIPWPAAGPVNDANAPPMRLTK